MQDLFKKYLDNKCSPAEVKELLGYFNAPGNELLLRQLITESLEIDADSGGSEWHSITEKTYTLIKEQLETEKANVIPVFRKTWFRIAAAAVLLIGGFAVYKLISSPDNQKQEIVKTGTDQTEIGPASNKAVLTLADGSAIILESAAIGTLTLQGDTKIAKLENGQVAYNLLNDPSTSLRTTKDLINSIATPRGGYYQLTLSDGSRVWLNAASTLRFPVAFAGRERRVEITGEVYFEVAKNASMPFKVNVAGKGEVEVLGTHFNINSYSDEATINTTLLEGSVKVTALSTLDSRVIAPGEQAQLNARGHVSLNKKAEIEQAIAWKKGIFNFTNANLATVVRELSRWYDVDIEFEGPVPQRQFDGEMQRDMKLSQVLKLLEKNNVYCRLVTGDASGKGKKLIVLK